MTNVFGQREVPDLSPEELDQLALMIDEALTKSGKKNVEIANRLSMHSTYLSQARNPKSISLVPKGRLEDLCRYLYLEINEIFPWTDETRKTAKERAQEIGRKRKTAQLAAALNKDKKKEGRSANPRKTRKDKAIAEGHLKPDMDDLPEGSKEPELPAKKLRKSEIITDENVQNMVDSLNTEGFAILDFHQLKACMQHELDMKRSITVDSLKEELLVLKAIEDVSKREIPEKMSDDEFEELRAKAQEVIDKELEETDLSEMLIEKFKAAGIDIKAEKAQDLLDRARDTHKEPFKGYSAIEAKKPNPDVIQLKSTETFTTYEMLLDEDTTVDYTVCVGNGKYEIVEMNSPGLGIHKLIHSREHLKMMVDFLQTELNALPNE